MITNNKCEWCDAEIDGEDCGSLCVDCAAADRKQTEDDEDRECRRWREIDNQIDAARGK